MSDDFKYDAFLSHSSKDKVVVRALAERLHADGVRVWFDEWELRPGDNIPSKIEEGLDHARVLVLCMSVHAFGSDWSKLEAGTFRFRDPLNNKRRFVPLRLDESPIKGSLAQFLYINWVTKENEQEYAKLLAACRPSRRRSKRNLASPAQLGENPIKPDPKLGRILQFPIAGTNSLAKQRQQSAEIARSRGSRGGAEARATHGGVSVAIAGSHHGNISIKMPANKSSGTKYPANSIGADANLTNYIEYLCELYVKFMKTIEPNEATSWAKLGKSIKTKFRLRKRTRNHLSKERFQDLVDFLINEKLARTPVGRKHHREGKKLCRTFDEYRHGKM